MRASSSTSSHYQNFSMGLEMIEMVLISNSVSIMEVLFGVLLTINI